MVTLTQMMATSRVPVIDLNPFDNLNPLNWIAISMREARDKIISMVELVIANPPRISDDITLQELYRVSLAPTQQIAWVIFVYAFVIAALTFNTHGRLLYALLVALVTVAIAPSYIYLMNEMAQVGDTLANAASGMFTSQMSKNLDSIGNVLLDSGSFGAVVFTAGLAYGAFVSSDPAYALMVFLIPLAFAVSGLGSRSRNVFNAFASIAIVLALAGRFVAILTLEFFQGLSETQPGTNRVFLENLVTAASFFIAVTLQVMLMIVCYTGIKRVQGAIASQLSNIKSQVKTSVSNVVRVRVEKSNNQPARPIPVVIVPPSQPGIRETARSEASSAAVRAGIKAAAAGAGVATGNPKVAVVVQKAGTFIAENRKGAS